MPIIFNFLLGRTSVLNLKAIENPASEQTENDVTDESVAPDKPETIDE